MFFNRLNDKATPRSKEKIQATIKPLNYSDKILVAWGEAISGNSKIRDFLIKNGYQELGLFCFALTNDIKSLQWLLKNGYPHLAALVKAAEGDQQALDWLNHYKFDLLKFMALAAQGDKRSIAWLKHKDPFAMQLAYKIKIVKDRIDERNNDVHQINP